MDHQDRSDAGDTPSGKTIERDYVLAARIRLLVPWLSFKNVGLGRIRWTSGEDGVEAIELLVGSDTARTPRRINRWGYEAERWVGNAFRLTGVMTESNEASTTRSFMS